jgi:hypothetical protein
MSYLNNVPNNKIAWVLPVKESRAPNRKFGSDLSAMICTTVTKNVKAHQGAVGTFGEEQHEHQEEDAEWCEPGDLNVNVQHPFG